MFCLKLKFWGRWGKNDQDQVRDLEGDLDVVVVDKVDMSQHQGVSRTSGRDRRTSYMHNCIICSSASSTPPFCLNAPFSSGVQCCSVRWTICHTWRSQKCLQANCSHSCSLSHLAGSFDAGPSILWSMIFALLESWFLLAWMPRRTSLWVCSKPPLCCFWWIQLSGHFPASPSKCYMRHTLGGTHEETLLPWVTMRGGSSQRGFKGLRSKLIALRLKSTLDCTDQEWGVQYVWQTTYTRVCASIEGHGTSRNTMSKQEHIINTIESDSMKKAVHR